MASFAENMLAKTKTLLEQNVGVEMVKVGDTTVSYTKLREDYQYWKSEVAREQGTRPRAARIDLSGF